MQQESTMQEQLMMCLENQKNKIKILTTKLITVHLNLSKNDALLLNKTVQCMTPNQKNYLHFPYVSTC